MIHYLRRGFLFSRPNSLLPTQKIKEKVSVDTSIDLAHFNNTKFFVHKYANDHVPGLGFFFFVLILSMLFTIHPSNLANHTLKLQFDY